MARTRAIIRADFEPHHPIGFLAARGQHQHRHRRSPPDAPQHFQSVEFGQHPIEDDEIRLGAGLQLQRGQSVTRAADSVARRFEFARDDLR